MSGGTHNAPAWLPRALAVVAVLGVALTWLWWRNPGERSGVATPSAASTALTARDEPASVHAPAELVGAAAVKLRELQALSETFRNTTFLIAIRDAGYVCHELIGIYGGIDNSATWTATCRDMLAYTVRVADSGVLAVEPMLQYWDGVGPAPVEREFPEPLR
jgi:hypothetical protein